MIKIYYVMMCNNLYIFVLFYHFYILHFNLILSCIDVILFRILQLIDNVTAVDEDVSRFEPVLN